MEEIIKSYFQKIKSFSDDNLIKNAFDSLTDEQQADFLNFDGNVQGFRILRKLGLAHDNFSYNLTMPILATIIKYPYSSLEGNKKMSDGGKYSQKKYGYFTSEKEDYNRIIETLGLKGKTRHPLTFLLEAADDIAYSVSDIEDGHKLGIITLDRIKRTFSTHDCPGELVGLKKYESNMDLYVRLLRIKCQSKMLIKTTKEYNRRINEIIEGDFDSEILKVSEASKLRDVFKELSVYNFSNIKVLKY